MFGGHQWLYHGVYAPRASDIAWASPVVALPLVRWMLSSSWQVRLYLASTVQTNLRLRPSWSWFTESFAWGTISIFRCNLWTVFVCLLASSWLYVRRTVYLKIGCHHRAHGCLILTKTWWFAIMSMESRWRQGWWCLILVGFMGARLDDFGEKSLLMKALSKVPRVFSIGWKTLVWPLLVGSSERRRSCMSRSS
jgi:hypothetical protein